jgi:CDP-glycerol glycerophosphotransferase
MKGHDIGVGDLLNTVRELKKSGRIVLYAPTFRDNLLVPAEEFLRYLGFDMARLDAVLTKHGAYVIMKFHHLVRTTKSSHRFAKISQRVHIISDPIDVYPILSQADVLVTDYSSVFFDFLLLDRPIVFYVPDYDTYLRERGFCLDFDSFTPGPKAKSFEQLLLALDDILIGADRFAEQRKRVREYAFDNVDGLSSERLLGSVMKIVHLRKA